MSVFLRPNCSNFSANQDKREYQKKSSEYIFMHFSSKPDNQRPTECISYQPPAPSNIRDKRVNITASCVISFFLIFFTQNTFIKQLRS